MNTTGMSAITRVNFYNTYAPGKVVDPYDCAAQKPGPNGNTTKYCLQSRFYSCATKLNCPIPGLPGTCTPQAQQKIANFLPCAEGHTAGHLSSFSAAAPCAKRFGLDVGAIQACAAGSEPVAVIDMITKATASAKSPSVSYFPDVRVAEMQLKDPTAQGLIAAVCKAYKGASKPAACSK